MSPQDKPEKFFFAIVKGFNAKGELEAVASTGSTDRQKEVILPEAWQKSLPTYRANPVILATHQHRLTTGSSPVIGSASAIDVSPDELAFRMTFAGTPLGREYEQLYREKHMRAFSVGFLPVAGEWRTVKVDGKDERMWVHTEAELLEISAVPVPANPEALARMRAAMAGGFPGSPDADAIAKDVAGLVLPSVLNASKELDTKIAAMAAEWTATKAVLLDRLAELNESLLLMDEYPPPDKRGQATPKGGTPPSADRPPAHGDAVGVKRAAKALTEACG